MSDFMKFFDVEYLPKLGVRAPTFRAVMREALHQGVQTIVETGCVRKEGNWEGDGQSTIIFSAFTRFNKCSFTTVDLDQEAIELVGKLTSGAAACICADSVPWLAKEGPKIDLLYLDSLDVDKADAGPAAMHCLFEFCSARPRLKSGSIVFIDDCPMGPDGAGGKGTFVAKWFQQMGIQPFTWGYQAAWLLP